MKGYIYSIMSNMNIPYINEHLFAVLLCKTKYTYLLNVWELQLRYVMMVYIKHTPKMTTLLCAYNSMMLSF